MKRFFLVAMALLLISGCRATKELQYRLEIGPGAQERQEDLVSAALRVLERRAQALETEIETTVDREGDHALVHIVLSDAEKIPLLEEGLAEPFKLGIHRQAEEGEKADIEVEGHGGFIRTPVTEQHMRWVTGSTDASTGKGVVNLQFTPEGVGLLETVFIENAGKSLGLFLRGRLVSKLLVEDEKVGENIAIAGIPSPELATIFADDVNVGVYVKFVPVE